MMTPTEPPSALQEFKNNLRAAPRRIYETAFRDGPPTTDRTRSTFIFSNVFLHLHSVRGPPVDAAVADVNGAGHRVNGRVPDHADHRSVADVLLQAVSRRGVSIDQRHSLRGADRPFHAKHSPLGGECNGDHCNAAHGAGVLYRCVPEAPRVQLADGNGAPRADARALVYRVFAALGSTRVLGDSDRREHRAVAARGDRRDWRDGNI